MGTYGFNDNHCKTEVYDKTEADARIQFVAGSMVTPVISQTEVCEWSTTITPPSGFTKDNSLPILYMRAMTSDEWVTGFISPSDMWYSQQCTWGNGSVNAMVKLSLNGGTSGSPQIQMGILFVKVAM